jgi:CYTH domain-containing protein
MLHYSYQQWEREETMGKIIVTEISDLTEIIAGLVREGVVFKVAKYGETWEIELTGGC